MWLCPTELAMDMAINIQGPGIPDTVKVTFLEPVDDNWSRVINEDGKIQQVHNGRLSLWK